MDQIRTIDEIARTSDEAAVLAEFNARTLAALRVISILAVVTTFAHVVNALAEGAAIHVALAGVSFATACLTALATRKSAAGRPARFVRERARGIAIIFAVIETTALVLIHAPEEGAMVFGMIIPLLMLSYRLLPAEHVLLHGSLAAICSFVGVMLGGTDGGAWELIVPAVMMNVMVLMGSQMISRRVRINTVANWSERRSSAREQIRMRDELRYARDLQLSMLPDAPPPLEWLDIAAISIPATEVGGDYFDYFVEGGHITVVSGDVAGHGMASGLVLASIRSGFTLLREDLRNPAVVLTRLHDLVATSMRRRMLVTVSTALIDYETSQVTIASAGHPPVLIRRADGSVETIELFAPPLGVRLPIEIPQRTLAFGSGDILLLHSDGVYEAQNEAGELYGLERLAAVLAAHDDSSSASLRDAILGDLTRFRGSAEQSDDVTLVVCRRR
jgi:serine phosphatase RsbU (regulator of sigma subunit)